MNYKNLLFFIFLFLITACNNDNNNNDYANRNRLVADAAISTSYTITETFEGAAKGSYTDANIMLSTGSWDFNDAVTGDLRADVKNGERSARIRNGFIAMNFDLSGVTSISLKHARYGHDANSFWQLLMSTDGGVTYAQIGGDKHESNTTFTTDFFSIKTIQKVRFEIKNTGRGRINIDDITFKGLGNPGIKYNSLATDTTSHSAAGAAESRGIVIGPDAPPLTGDNSDLLLGNPSGASASITMMDNYLIDQGYYTESYNATKGEPNWVSWHLDAANITSTSHRQNDFAGFSGLPAGWFKVLKSTYDGSGFDRGHNCPSADRTSSTNANEATFLMTNMVPQAPENNQHTWAGFENYLRLQVKSGYEVYVIMGSYGSGGSGSKGFFLTIGNGHVNVPSNIWKVALIIPAGNNDIVRVNRNTAVIAVNTPNTNSISPNWRNYIVTVKAIENATGYQLFSSLPQNIQIALETATQSGI